MSNFITTSDYNASIHAEILAAITRDDTIAVDICEDRAIQEMRGYLGVRYDCDALFAASGTARNQLVLMMAVDITVYHIFCIGNPQKLSQMRKDRYDRAVEWLKAVSKGAINIDGAPLLPAETLASKSSILMSSNPKRSNHL